MHKLKLIIRKTYPVVQGEYLGETYQYMDVVAESAQSDDAQSRPSRIVFRIKGTHLDRFMQRMDSIMDGRLHEFAIVFSAKETKWNDGTIHPQNNMPVCVGVE